MGNLPAAHPATLQLTQKRVRCAAHGWLGVAEAHLLAQCVNAGDQSLESLRQLAAMHQHTRQLVSAAQHSAGRNSTPVWVYAL
jgi:hypothetical protein